MDHDAAGPFSRSTIEEVVDEKAARIETMILGLRILEGVTRSRFRERHGLDYDQVFGEQLRLLEEAGLLALEKSAVRLTEKGLDFADRVARELL
jgi:oxygen-independent coproporphyrinogen-3 oxidase